MKTRTALKEIMMEDRTAGLTILIDPNRMIRDFLAKHRVGWTRGDE
ncbi:MAG: hypothetical protein K2Q01_04855 [Rickettsiales bacterium]|nr:hypothetical protein [Rickettsiales bacterium]